MKYITVLFLSLFATNVFAKTTANLKNGVMIYGYDPVSYFTSAKPSKGQSQYQVQQGGLTYYFESQKNKDEFQKNPQKYSPQYEGWCATAVAEGYKYDIDPLNYKVTDGKLYLFYKGWKGDAKKPWLKNEPEQIKKADVNWPQVKNQEE